MYKSKADAILCLLVLLVSINLTVIGKGSGTIITNQHSKENYDVKFYHLDLNVSDSSIYIDGSTTILLASLVDSLQQVVLDFSDKLVTDSVLVNGSKINCAHALDELTIDLAVPVNTGILLTIKVYYHGLGRYSGETSGIYNKYSSSWDTRITWTLSESFSALKWFPCKQSLTDKADSVYVFLSTDNDLKAGSNGLLEATVPLPDNRIRYEWKSRYPIDYYLISFAVGNYSDYSFYVPRKNAHDSILVQNYIYNNPAYFEQNKAAIDKTSDLILLYADLFGNYPFGNEKYGHCVAPLGGGMEHQTMTTLVNFDFLLVAHELAHQWFGDYITCSTWQDIWINEGFASYAEYLADQYLKSQLVADSWITNVHNSVKFVPNGSIYIPEELVNNEDRIFDSRLSYKKGAAMIHMIRQEVGNDSLFFKTLSGFIEKYKNSHASGIDLKNYLEEITGNDFDQFFDQWYFGEGYPIHNISWSHEQDTLYISSLQTVSSVTPFFNVLLEFNVTLNGKDTLISLRQTSNFNKWQVCLQGNVSSIAIDPHKWLLFELDDLSEAITQMHEPKLKVVPNPAKEKVNIYFSSQVGKYNLYLANASGRILHSETATIQHKVIDIGSYPQGIYLIIIKDGNTIHHAKFIVN